MSHSNKVVCFLIFLLGCGHAVGVNAFSANARTGDFALIDHTGTYFQLSYFSDQKAVVLVAQNNRSLASSAAAVGELAAEFADAEVVVAHLNGAAEAREAVVKAAQSSGVTLPVLLDDAQLVSAGLGLERAGALVVIGPDRKIAYRGAVDDLDAARAALRAVVAGDAVTAVEVASSGAVLNLPTVGEVSYSRDIVPLLAENCVACHRDGAIAPWSMSSHAMVRGWSPMMREVVMTRRMPPGQIDTHVSKPIMDVAGLSVAQRQKLIAWIDAGAPVDGDADPLAQMTFSDPKFSLGEPDLVYKVPAQDIPATGVVDYRYVPVELNLDKDVWVEAMEFVPGDRQVLHHVIAYLSKPADKAAKGRSEGPDQGQQLAGFAPGRQPDQFRDNSGRLIPKGSNLLLQMHYTTSGKAAVDETLIGIYLHDKLPEHVMSGGVAGQRRFFVPAYDKEYKLQGEQLIERDAYLYSMTPHMHYRGKYMSYLAQYPDGTSETLLSVPKYDFNWQFNYDLEEPVFLPAGTKLIARGAMDNSAQNPGNPDPSKPVLFGLQTKHEMFFGFTTLRYVGDTPANLVADKDADTPAPAGR
ncbi:MAG: hypothetical protein AAF513_06330 [Pseudomonadota bacterium]